MVLAGSSPIRQRKKQSCYSGYLNKEICSLLWQSKTLSIKPFSSSNQSTHPSKGLGIGHRSHEEEWFGYKKLPAALEQKMAGFLQAVREVRKEYGYPKELIGNMDKTRCILICRETHLSTEKGLKLSQCGLQEQTNVISLWCWQQQLMVRCSRRWSSSKGKEIWGISVYQSEQCLVYTMLVILQPYCHCLFAGIGLYVCKKKVGWMNLEAVD